MEHYNQVTGIVYRKISDKYGLEVPTSKWEMPPRVVENNRAKILWDFRVHTVDVDTVVVDEQRKKAVVIDVAI